MIKAQDVAAVSTNDAEFDDIRPCKDEEVQAELEKICNDETVINSILKFRHPMFSVALSFLLKPFVKRYLKKTVASVHTIADFQQMVAAYMRHVIATTTDGVRYEGFDKLSKDQGYLFISNHRDISLDPAFIDMALFSCNMDTVRIAIGDNLLRIPAATSLMKLNKSFIVRRSVTSPREKLKALNHLSEYIGLSVKEGHSVWIAQREGRAKDGDDRTEDAVLKMISLYGRRLKQDFGTYMSSLNIVPVSISYEYDPNDLAKARELLERERNHGEYHKDKLEDIETITRGIRSYKGRVVVRAGAPVLGGFETPEQLAAIIDNFVWKNYELFPPVMISAGQKCDDQVACEKFKTRLESYPEELRDRIKAMYAKPYENFMACKES